MPLAAAYSRLDLLGSDLPTPGQEAARFRWCDGALLRAMRQGAGRPKSFAILVDI